MVDGLLKAWSQIAVLDEFNTGKIVHFGSMSEVSSGSV